MEHVNNTTQQNASASEQLSATAEQLSAQAAQLQELMAYFQLAPAMSGASFAPAHAASRANGFGPRSAHPGHAMAH